MGPKNIIPEGAQAEKARSRQWYAVQTYSGYEEAVARYLKQRVESLAMGIRYSTFSFRKRRR